MALLVSQLKLMAAIADHCCYFSEILTCFVSPSHAQKQLTIKLTPGVKGCHDVVPDVDSVDCT